MKSNGQNDECATTIFDGILERRRENRFFVQAQK